MRTRTSISATVRAAASRRGRYVRAVSVALRTRPDCAF